MADPDPDVEFVRQAFQAFEVQEGTLELEVQLGNTYELEGGRIKHLRVYVGHDRAVEAARAGG